jgi:glutamate/tyrosine decarboxylase-like PLP-dependent enzyme
MSTWKPGVDAGARLRPLLEQAHSYALDYLDGVEQMRVVPDARSVAGLEAFDEELPREGASAEETLRMLHEIGSPATVAQTGGRYFGFVTGALHPPALAAKWLADVWDQNPALHVISPATAKLEEICERWLVELFKLPEGTAAGFVTGTSMSLFCGIAAARNELLRRQGWDVVADGLVGAPEIRVLVGEQAHGTVFKALSLLGLGRDKAVRLPCDDQGRIIADEVPELDEHTLLVLQAGNVNSGAFDPLEELCRRGQSSGTWVHVDGAFGLWAAASPRTYPLYRGAELADSWSVDAHKTLNSPYDCGIVLCRDREALASAMQASGSYILWSDKRDGMLYTPDMSRRARGPELWATLKTLGRSGVAELVEQLFDRATQFAELLRASGFRVLNDVVFNQVLVAGDTPDETGAVLDEVQASGECWCGGATWRGEPVIRISVCSWATTPRDVERSARAFVEARARASR